MQNVDADLEHFAYSASHDLQEPLRTVKIFSELLAASIAGKLDSQSLEFLNSVMAGASRMEALIRDLLTYTQTMSVEITGDAVSAQAALDGALINLKGAIEESGATVDSDALPALRVHVTHLQQLFQNLIGNAIKYAKLNVAPVVHLKATQHNEEWLFSVSDNGIGIEPQYKQRIFGLFKRLHRTRHLPTHSGSISWTNLGRIRIRAGIDLLFHAPSLSWADKRSDAILRQADFRSCVSALRSLSHRNCRPPVCMERLNDALDC